METKLPFAVQINKKTYNVELRKGDEYQLSELDGGGIVCRVCHVKTPQVGETIKYFWRPEK